MWSFFVDDGLERELIWVFIELDIFLTYVFSRLQLDLALLCQLLHPFQSLLPDLITHGVCLRILFAIIVATILPDKLPILPQKIKPDFGLSIVMIRNPAL